MNSKVKGYIFGAIAAATYGMNPLFALPLYKAGMNTDSVLFFRYLLAIPIIGIMIVARGRNFKLSGVKDVGALIIMGMLMAISSLTLFQSYNYMDIGIASTLLFVYPVLVALIMWFVYKERISLLTAICILVTLGGVALLFKGGDGVSLNLIGVLFVFASSLSYAIYIVAINNKRLQKIATLKITFYVLVFGIFLFATRLLVNDNLCMPEKFIHWVYILALAIFPTTISFLCSTLAVQYVGATVTAILGALEPVTALFFGMAIFGERLSLREWVGVFLIIIAVTVIVGSGNIEKYLVRFRKLFPAIKKHNSSKN
jgi:Predicted permease, DMT superfamily